MDSDPKSDLQVPWSLRAQATTKMGVKTCWNWSYLAEPIESVPNRLNRLIKNLKLYQKIPWRIRNLKKNGAQFQAWMRENRLKQCKAFIKRGCHQATRWTGSQSVQPVEKSYEIITVDSLNKKESKKINSAQFRSRMGENRPKQGNVFIKWENDSK